MDNNANNSELNLPSNELAKQIISSVCSGVKKSSYSISQLLGMYKNKKHPNYEKFSQHVEKQLSSYQKDIYQIMDDLLYLGKKMQEADISESQRKSIVMGYRKFIQKFLEKENLPSKSNKELADYLLKNYFCFDRSINPLISDLMLICCGKFPETTRQSYQKQLYESIVDVVRFRKMSSLQAEQCCILIHHMNLYQHFKTQDLTHIVQQNNSNYISYFFHNRKGKKFEELIEVFIAKQCSSNEAKVKKLISALDLDPFKYSQLIKALNKKSLRYFLNNEPIYALDLKIAARPDIAECLVEILIDQKRFKQAMHFINKHYLTKFYCLNPTQDRSYNKNILQKFDEFSPTEHILASRISYQKTSYLTLPELGYKRDQVRFLNKDTITPKILANILNSPRFGIDCENNPVFNQYEKSKTQTAQIAIDYKQYDLETEEQEHIKEVYVIDLVDMSDCQFFKEWVKNLCQSYKGMIVGHTVKKDFNEFVHEVMLDQQLNMEKLNFFDIALEFKKKYNDTKSNLEYMCRTVLQKNLSKFEQCSGWNNRPLRQAQLHYAALDAALTLAIYSKL